MTIFKLDDDIYTFPDPCIIPEEERDPDGFYAIGGDLSLPRLIEAYQMGVFPWFPYDSDEIQWFCPLQRFVIRPSQVHVSHSLRTLLNKKRYTFTVDKCFDKVIENCSLPRRDKPGAWLGDDMINAYMGLHRLGYAHSVEVWEGERLVGGLYGVLVNQCFIGESMFSLVPSGSKLALVHLGKVLEAMGVEIIDCQIRTDHLASMGGEYMPYNEYLASISHWF